jgi:hypothetical protein
LKEVSNLLGFEYGDDVFESLKIKIHLLSNVISLFEGDKNVVKGECRVLLVNQIFNIRNKALYLLCVYDARLLRHGKDTMNGTGMFHRGDF